MSPFDGQFRPWTLIPNPYPVDKGLGTRDHQRSLSLVPKSLTDFQGPLRHHPIVGSGDAIRTHRLTRHAGQIGRHCCHFLSIGYQRDVYSWQIAHPGAPWPGSDALVRVVGKIVWGQMVHMDQSPSPNRTMAPRCVNGAAVEARLPKQPGQAEQARPGIIAHGWGANLGAFATIASPSAAPSLMAWVRANGLKSGFEVAAEVTSVPSLTRNATFPAGYGLPAGK
jgi:hypothetical protein